MPIYPDNDYPYTPSKNLTDLEKKDYFDKIKRLACALNKDRECFCANVINNSFTGNKTE